jgi:hypothetical protein
MTEKRIEMKFSDKYTYNEQRIYISFETFGKDAYVLCSYTNDDKGKFKLNKSEL